MSPNKKSRLRSRRLTCVALLINGIVPAYSLEAQTAANPQVANNQEVRRLSGEAIVQLLRKPDGLAAAAKIVGAFVLPKTDQRWAYFNLASLTKGSSIIVDGTVTSRTSRLISKGDQIETDYLVSPLAVLKGTVNGPLQFTAEGGLIAFPNNTSAEISTVEWRRLQEGHEFIFFLDPAVDNLTRPTNGVESFFEVSKTTSAIEALAAENNGPHTITKEVKGVDVSTFIAMIKALIPVADSTTATSK